MNEVESAEQLLQRGQMLCDLRRFGEAVTVIGRALAITPDDSSGWCLLAQAQLSLDDDEGALAAAQRAAALAPEAEWPHRLQSIALESQGRHQEALASAFEAVRLGPFVWQAHSQAAVMLATENRKTEAEAAVTRMLQLGPNEARAWVIAGNVAANRGGRNSAQERYRNALRLDPQDSAAHSGLARLEMRRRSANPAGLADAAAGLATAVRADPRNQRNRRTIDHLLCIFLARAAYFMFVVCYVAWRASNTDHAAQIWPALLIAAPAAYVWRFVARLDLAVRAHLFRSMETPFVGVATLADLLAALAIVCASFVSPPAMEDLFQTALVLALIGRLSLFLQLRRVVPEVASRIANMRWVAWAGVVGLGGAGLLLLAAAATPGGGHAAVAGAIMLLAAAGVAFQLVRSRRAAGSKASRTR